ncbi:beta-N-acetylglucosaminidase domain-containing protein [Sphingosinicella sp. CPCC 101087]|uniref:beta-N-acetylglucosaminidase domain-containing protein n=1 Tax=Sphingosinicella sp. CPCC 101087 TaxID=2497754 RepID=UPI00101DE06F|nr:beta-N-acetylglucosaminidase domain-containing protein [Sphingosinicella sp. CPCC 101087]
MTPPLALIEGFFGRPWSWRDRSEAVRFLAPHGYGAYLYAPKADPWLRRGWREPYPDNELEALAAFGRDCNAAGVRLGAGLSPFELHLEAGRNWETALNAKVAQLDQAGVEDLAILFDDMRGDVPDLAERQAAIVHHVAERTGASRLLCCPSYYSDDPVLDTAFGERPAFYLEQLGRLLDPSIRIMWTGEEVVSREYSPGHLSRIAEAIGRKPFLWDNYPVNDGARMSQHLHLRAFTGRPAAIAAHISDHGINLASQPLLSRIPALTLAESYARGDAYEYGAAFGWAAAAVLGAELAERVRRDLLALQDRGLDRLADRRAVLRDRYAGFDHPAAREIIAWLDGEWDVTDELVQTQ